MADRDGDDERGRGRDDERGDDGRRFGRRDDRPPGGAGGGRSFDRSGGQRPYQPRGGRSFDRGGGRSFDRGGGRSFDRGGDRPFDRRPRGRPGEPPGDRPFERRGGRPFEQRGDRPYGQRGDRPYDARGERPFRRPPDEDAGDRGDERAERPGRPFERRPRFDRGPVPRRPAGFGGQPRPPVGRPPAAPDGSSLIGEGEEVVAGRRPVSEAFAARRDARRLIVVPDRRAALESLVLHATTLRLPIVEVEGGTLTSLTGFDGHQGIALVVGERPAASVDDMMARARARGEAPFVLVLDSLEDPQNLGTLLRSAEACGVHGVIYPSRHAAPLTAAAIKSSAGATEHLLLASVDNLPGTLADLRAAGLRLVGADEGAPLRYGEADLRGPLALVVGSEERGISGALRRRLDMTVRIPMRGRVGSLNAAVAGSVLLFAAAEQRGAPESGDRPPDDLPEQGEKTAAAEPTEEGAEANEPGDDATDPGDDANEPGDDATEAGDDANEPGDDATEAGDDAAEPGDAAPADPSADAAPAAEAVDDELLPGEPPAGADGEER